MLGAALFCNFRNCITSHIVRYPFHPKQKRNICSFLINNTSHAAGQSLIYKENIKSILKQWRKDVKNKYSLKENKDKPMVLRDKFL